jgi:hypothetical protein
MIYYDALGQNLAKSLSGGGRKRKKFSFIEI